MDESNETEIIFIAQPLGRLILLGQNKESVSEPDVAESDESEAGEQVEKQESVSPVVTESLLFLKGMISENNILALIFATNNILVSNQREKNILTL